MKTMQKVQKVKEAELQKFAPLNEAYKSSAQYKKLIEDVKKKDEDDDFRIDTDPQGYDLYKLALEDPLGKVIVASLSVAQHNPECGSL